MKRIVSASLMTLATAPALLLIAPAARSETYTYCYPVEQVRMIKDPGSHPTAYDDGYREGAEMARRGETYEPRTAGGEFSRGYDDGYYGRSYTGQRNTVPNRRETYSTSQCNTYSYDKDDDIDEILDDVVRSVERDLRRDMSCDRNERR
ncbi:MULTISPECIES: hypothetical protein [unclassified Coleofasciculus]|uniref:hypothetical protein n=1 Tax=unclassified Coleofasciculus TaxID=2692782 RepID=UPI00187EFEF0|nr:MULTISPECIES: hypothetical protein [unclassified Coleofasciculus]MBE9126577.1 hypothetical protein [Coleofasciculus sp. LEGE 07081]MBE9149942.1 hypothetical protein [Coleofasciculus sp. LEGE 07092]